MPPAPTRPGDALGDIDTPALIVDLDAFERNLDRMAAGAARAGVALRPHAKSHKCPDIALMQIARGAAGICCQKVSEAEAMVAGGVGDVLVANEVVDPRKLARLAALARTATISLCADDPGAVDAAARAAAEAGGVLTLLVEIDVGAGRCGVPPGDPALALAERIAGHGSLRFGGLQAYHGSAQHLRAFADRRAAAAQAAEAARETAARLDAAGLGCPTVTGAGTGSWAFEATSGVYTEIQPGSYVFMDADYARNLDEDGAPVHDFEQSLFLWTQVMSRPAPGRAVLDAGLKATSVDSGPPLPVDPGGAAIAGAEVSGVSDEHIVLRFDGTSDDFTPGDKLRLIPGHCDPTVNLHDWLVAVRGGQVEAVWPVAARGPGH